MYKSQVIYTMYKWNRLYKYKGSRQDFLGKINNLLFIFNIIEARWIIYKIYINGKDYLGYYK